MSSVKVTAKETVIYTIEVGADTAAKLEALLAVTQRFTDEGEDLHTDLEDLYMGLPDTYTTDIVDGQVILTKDAA